MLWQRCGNVVSDLTKLNGVTTLPQRWALAGIPPCWQDVCYSLPHLNLLVLTQSVCEFHIICHLLSWASGGGVIRGISHVHNMGVSHFQADTGWKTTQSIILDFYCAGQLKNKWHAWLGKHCWNWCKLAETSLIWWHLVYGTYWCNFRGNIWDLDEMKLFFIHLNNARWTFAVYVFMSSLQSLSPLFFNHHQHQCSFLFICIGGSLLFVFSCEMYKL